MDRSCARRLLGFYENELVNNILFFWDEKCIDRINGGYFNCFDNRGETLLSRDKYTWSQGRFVWMWARLAAMDCGTFTRAQRASFLENARLGRDFLAEHCLVAPNDWRCAYLLDEAGGKKTVEGWGDRLDLSISADNFVAAGFAQYARSAGDRQSYTFAKSLYLSMRERYASGDYLSLPYRLPEKYRSHPMGMICLTAELHSAALVFDPPWTGELKLWLKEYVDEMLDCFVDEEGVLRETLFRDGSQLPSILGQHMNPGHILEAMWFILDAVQILGEQGYLPKIAAVAQKALECGWDAEYGGLLHFCSVAGGQPAGQLEPDGDEPMLQLVLKSWDDKLWWVHSEALYSTLLLHRLTREPCFLEWHDRVFDYTFEKHPNPDREVREWVQILTRDGRPQEKVVALPVKDPYHITRNLILIIELLYRYLEEEPA